MITRYTFTLPAVLTQEQGDLVIERLRSLIPGQLDCADHLSRAEGQDRLVGVEGSEPLTPRELDSRTILVLPSGRTTVNGAVEHSVWMLTKFLPALKVPWGWHTRIVVAE